jgi:small subunit ribosomal protein S6e
MQIVVGTQDGQTHSFNIADDQKQPLMGLKLGDEFDGSVVGLDGYTLEITGGSDQDGFPMKKQVQGTGRRKMLVTGGTGVRDLDEGERSRKSLRGNTVADDIVQLNCRVVEQGSESVEELLSEDEE